MWAELETAREKRREKRREESRDYQPPLYDPYYYYSRPAYYSIPRHGIPRHHRPKLARRQFHALEELDLTGPRPYSINSTLHHARIQQSRGLNLVSPKAPSHPKLPRH
jgi:hypothetical protein